MNSHRPDRQSGALPLSYSPGNISLLVEMIGIEPTKPEVTGLQPAELTTLLNISTKQYLAIWLMGPDSNRHSRQSILVNSQLPYLSATHQCYLMQRDGRSCAPCARGTCTFLYIGLEPPTRGPSTHRSTIGATVANSACGNTSWIPTPSTLNSFCGFALLTLV